MIIKDKIFDMTDGGLDEIKEIAKIHPKGDSFYQCLERLKKIAENWEAEVHLYPDFAAYSLHFVIQSEDNRVMNGGLIYHGSHDDFGSGKAPTYSVSVDKTDGWSLHT